MSSRIKCKCGNIVRKNLFSGDSVNLVISDNDLDEIDDSWETTEAVSHIISKGHILVHCVKCNRIIIESRDTEKISSFKPDDDH